MLPLGYGTCCVRFISSCFKLIEGEFDEFFMTLAIAQANNRLRKVKCREKRRLSQQFIMRYPELLFHDIWGDVHCC